MATPSYGSTRRLAAAKQHEFSTVSGFKNGYRNREDLTTLPPGVLIPGSQNVLTNTNGRVAIRGGYSLDGQANSDLAPIASAFDWISTGGEEKNMRSGFLTSAGNDGKLQFRNVGADGTVTWVDLLTGLTSVDFNYVNYYNPNTISTQVLMVNGTNNFYTWGGATANILSAANPTGIIGTYDDKPQSPAASTDGSGGVDYVVGDVLTISGGSGTAAIKVGAVTAGAVKTTTIGSSGGTNYSVNDIVYIDGTGGLVLGFDFVVDHGIEQRGTGYKAGNVKCSGGHGIDQTFNILVSASGGIITSIVAHPDGVGYQIGDVLTITGGNEDANVVVTSVSASANGNASVLVTSVGGGGEVTGITIYRNGLLYATGSNFATTTQFGPGSGLLLNITATGNGVSQWDFISDADHGTGYSTGVATATGGSGTNAKFNIVTVTSGSLTKTGTQPWSYAGILLGHGSTLTLEINGVEYDYGHFNNVLGDTTTLYGVTPDPSGIPADSFAVEPVRVVPFTDYGFEDSFTPNLIGTLSQRVYLGTAAKAGQTLARGDIWISTVNDYTSYITTGSTGYGPVGVPVQLNIPSAPTAFVVQEQQMYIAAGTDEWYLVEFTLNSFLTDERVSIVRLNTTPLQAAQSQAATSKIANSVVFLSFEPIIRSFGRIPNILADSTPQMSDLSFTIVNDMNQYDFTNAALAYYRKFVYVAVPAEGLVLVYNMTDEQHPYWEAPQVLPISRFSIIDGELYGHSSEVSETYKLFTGYADRVTSTSQGNPIEAIWNFSFENYGSRFSLKKATKMYVEGYINANTSLEADLTYELDGCKTVKTFTLDGANTQFVCIGPVSGPLGKDPLGKVKLGGQLPASYQDLPPKFRWFPTFQNTDFFECSVSFKVLGLNERMELLAFGLAVSGSSEIPTDKMD